MRISANGMRTWVEVMKLELWKKNHFFRVEYVYLESQQNLHPSSNDKHVCRRNLFQHPIEKKMERKKTWEYKFFAL